MQLPRVYKICVVATFAALITGGDAWAAGLGQISVRSSLGQPLNASIPLIGTDASSDRWRCVAARMEALDGGTVATPTAELVHSAQAVTVRLTTRKNVNEPALNISVSIGCEESIRRDFQVLIDPVVVPPLLAQSPPAEPDREIPHLPSPLAAQRLPTPMAEAAAVPAAKGNRKGNTGASPAPAADQLSASVSPGGPRARKQARHQRPARSVLRLSGAEPVVGAVDMQLRLHLSDTLPPPAEPDPHMLADMQAVQPRVAATLRGEDPLRASETMVKHLQAERESLRTEVRRINRQSETDKAALEAVREEFLNWLKLLAALLFMSLGATGWLWWRINAMRKNEFPTAWSALWEDDHTVVDAPADETSHINTAAFSMTELKSFASKLPQSADEATMHCASDAPAPPAAAGGETGDGSDSAVSAVHGGKTAVQAGLALKAEEISDVMELVEVWMELNQPAKVKELLEPFSEAEQPQSPLPWLCLLDVYRALGDQQKYEAILTRITKLFNVKLSPWAACAGLEPAKALSDFPHIVVNILHLWDSEQVVPYLESLVLDNRSGERSGFDLPVYRDILRLIRLARDPRRLTPGEHNINAQAFAILSAARTQAIAGATDAQPDPRPEAPAARARMRERPKYITPSYERKILQRDNSTALSKTAASAGAAGKSAHDVATARGQQHGIGTDNTAVVSRSDTQATGAEPEGEILDYDELSPMAVKLHLALAYQDIGDKEGMQLLLEEVIQDGTEEQAEQARKMLAALA